VQALAVMVSVRPDRNEAAHRGGTDARVLGGVPTIRSTAWTMTVGEGATSGRPSLGLSGQHHLHAPGRTGMISGV
jgi:hypothetical protein